MSNLVRAILSTRSQDAYLKAMEVPRALLEVHAAVPTMGAPSTAMALNRSGVVLTVAAWQGWVENHVLEMLWWLRRDDHNGQAEWNDPRDRMLAAAARSLAGVVEHRLSRFSTPGRSQVIELLGLFEIDPRERWEGIHLGRRSLSASEVGKQLDEWVKVRHAIAHGDSHLPAVDVLDRTKAGHGSLRKGKVEQCLRFFDALVASSGTPTDEEFERWGL